MESGIWLVSFMRYDLGYIGLEEKTLQPLENPFGVHPGAADSKPNSNPQTTGSRSMKASGETDASNAGEQLAEGYSVRLIADDEQGRCGVFFIRSREDDIGPTDRRCLENSPHHPQTKTARRVCLIRRRRIANVLPMSQERTVTHVSGPDLGESGGGRGIRTPESLSTPTVFKTGAFNRSATPPG